MKILKKPKWQTVILLCLGLLAYVLLIRSQGSVRAIAFGNVNGKNYSFISAGKAGDLVVLRAGFASITPTNTPKNTLIPPFTTPTPSPTAGPSPTPTLFRLPTLTPTIPAKFVGFSRSPVRFNTLGPSNAVAFYSAFNRGYALLADGKQGLLVVDVTDPNHPVRVAAAPLPEAHAVAVYRNQAYVAAGSYGVYVVDLTNPLQPLVVDQRHTLGEAEDVDIYTRSMNTGEIVRMCVANGNAGIQVIQITNDSQPSGSALVMVGNKGLKAARVFPLQKLPYVDTHGEAHACSVTNGEYAFVADGGDGVYWIDLFPARPKIVTSLRIPGTAWDVAAHDKNIYVAAGEAGLVVLRTRTDEKTKQQNLEQISLLDTPGEAVGITLAYDYAFLGDGEGGVRVIDISRPFAPMGVDKVELSWMQVSLGYALANIFSDSAPTYNTLGNLTIDSLLFLGVLTLGLIVLTGFLLPLHSLRDRSRLLDRILSAVLSGFTPARFVENGSIKDLKPGEHVHGPGVVLLDAASAAVIKTHHKKLQPGKTKHGTGWPLQEVLQDFLGKRPSSQEGLEVIGQGLVITNKEQYIDWTISLERKNLVIGPKRGEDPFSLQGEAEGRADYRARQSRRRATVGLTRDGIEIVPTLRFVYSFTGQVDPRMEAGDSNAYGYVPQRVLQAYRGEHPPAESFRTSGNVPLPVEELLEKMAVALWREALKRVELDDLFNLPALESPLTPGASPTSLEMILQEMRNHFTRSEVRQVDEARQDGGHKLPSRIYWTLQRRGVTVHEISCEAVQIPEDEAYHLMRRWREAWLDRASSEKLNLDYLSEQQALVEFARSAIQFLKDQVGQAALPPQLVESLRLMLEGSQEACPPGSLERTRVEDILLWLKKDSK